MKFNVTSGKKKGYTFEVTDQEVTLGRKNDNQVVLDDESTSGHHAKLYPLGEQIVVEDCGSINGIEVNGKATKKSAIQPGDVIGIGGNKITAMADDDDLIDETADAVPRKQSKEKNKQKPSGSGKKILAIVLVIAVVGIAAAFPFFKKMKIGGGRGHTDPALVDNIFRVYYEKVDASSKNIFRYEVKLENNTLYVNIDDIEGKRQIRQSKNIDPKQIIQVKSDIQDQQIFSLPPKTEGKTVDVLESYVLRVMLKGEIHEIQVINSVLPDNLKRVCSGLEKFVEAELSIPSTSLSVDDLKKMAQESFLRARKLYDERFVNAQNLFDSIKSYQEVIWYLDTVEPKPGLYADAIHGKQVATDELDQQLKDHEFRSVKSISLKDWAKAREELLMILKKMPDTNDKRNQDAQQRLMDVDNRLKPQ
jgi:hypothetical protein